MVVSMTESSQVRRHPFSFGGRLIHAMLGAVVFGAMLPCLLVWIRCNGIPLETIVGDSRDQETYWQLNDLGFLFIISGIFCGPISLILAYGMMVARRYKYYDTLGIDPKYHMIVTAIHCAGLSFFNVPGYLAIEFFRADPYSPFNFLALFAVTGFTCGIWIGWQAWMEENPSAGAIPRFSLRTLVLFMIGWGVLLALFMPR